MTKKALGWPNEKVMNWKSMSGIFFLEIFFLFLCFSVGAQTGVVRGKVVDSVGNALQGVSVVVKGTKNGTSTKANGEFSLNGVPERSSLLLTFVGFTNQEVRLSSGQKTLNIVMS